MNVAGKYLGDISKAISAEMSLRRLSRKVPTTNIKGDLQLGGGRKKPDAVEVPNKMKCGWKDYSKSRN